MRRAEKLVAALPADLRSSLVAHPLPRADDPHDLASGNVVAECDPAGLWAARERHYQEDSIH